MLSNIKKIMHPTKSDFPPDNTNLTVTSDTLQTVDLTGVFPSSLGEHSRGGNKMDIPNVHNPNLTLA